MPSSYEDTRPTPRAQDLWCSHSPKAHVQHLNLGTHVVYKLLSQQPFLSAWPCGLKPRIHHRFRAPFTEACARLGPVPAAGRLGSERRWLSQPRGPEAASATRAAGVGHRVLCSLLPGACGERAVCLEVSCVSRGWLRLRDEVPCHAASVLRTEWPLPDPSQSSRGHRDLARSRAAWLPVGGVCQGRDVSPRSRGRAREPVWALALGRALRKRGHSWGLGSGAVSQRLTKPQARSDSPRPSAVRPVCAGPCAAQLLEMEARVGSAWGRGWELASWETV